MLANDMKSAVAWLNVIAVVCQGLPSVVAAPTPALPIVDLGYELHQAIAYNDTGNYYNFSNIRYAAPPLGANRFNVPQPPVTNRSAVQTGTMAVICPQATPSWNQFGGAWIAQYLTGQPITLTQAEVDANNNSQTLANVLPQSPTANEDCLFLDVMVPKNVFEKGGTSALKGAPVMVWIFGGGYVFGSKTNYGDPAGILARSETGGREGVVYVAINYRLGAFGWLAGPTFSGQGGTPNLGLYDQRQALEWVQENIHLFGGDPSRVTVFGESAGGGSITHQITAFGSKDAAPFARAIPQSPGFFYDTSTDFQDSQLETLFNITNTTTVAELQALSSEALIAANSLQVWRSRFGQFTYGPSVGGDFVPDLPQQLLISGNFAQNVEVMVGHNADEGLLFTNPLVTTEEALPSILSGTSATESALTYISNTLYPANFNGTYGYTNEIARQALLLSDDIFLNIVDALAKAFAGKSYSYEFAIPPALHAQDAAYTFFNGIASTVANVTAAYALQDWLVTFAHTGMPKTPLVVGDPHFDTVGAKGRSQQLNTASIVTIDDPLYADVFGRQTYWQNAEFQ